MPIKALKKLPIAARTMFEKIYSGQIDSGKSESTSAKVALEVVKKHYREPTKTKSASFQQVYNTNSSNHIEVLLGYPSIDAHGEYLDIWHDSPMLPITGDMEHINFQKIEGLPVDYPDEWDGFTPVADRYYHKGDELWASVELPNHPYTETFKKDWDAGKYGASVELAYPDEAVEYDWIDGQFVPIIRTATITGFTFTDNPALNTKNRK